MSQTQRMSVGGKTVAEIQEVCDGNASTGFVGVWKDKWAEGEPTYKLLSDGTAQYICLEGAGSSTTSGFGSWDLTSAGQVKICCKVKKGCINESDASKGTEEHELSMHCMMFEGVYKRIKELNSRDEDRVRMLADGKEVPPLHPITVVDYDGDVRGFDLFMDEKLSNLKDRLKMDTNAKLLTAKVMLGSTELTEGEPLCKLVPAKGELRIVIPKEDAAAPTEIAPADDASGKKDKISEAFKKWDVNNEGLISEQELGRILVALGVPQDDIPTIFAHADAKKGGNVDYMGFINWIYTSAKQASSEYEKLYKDKIDSCKCLFPYVSSQLVLDMLIENNGDRPSVTKALLKREDEMAAKFPSQLSSLMAKVPGKEKAAVLEALNACGGDEAAAIKAIPAKK